MTKTGDHMTDKNQEQETKHDNNKIFTVYFKYMLFFLTFY